jgi:hypothetical protein
MGTTVGLAPQNINYAAANGPVQVIIQRRNSVIPWWMMAPGAIVRLAMGSTPQIGSLLG